MKIHVKHILVKEKYEAEDLLRKLQQGKEFSDLAQKFSICSSSQRGGDLGEVHISRLDESFADAACALKIGQMSSMPVRSRFGYHLILRCK